jgi:hypothetical protein
MSLYFDDSPIFHIDAKGTSSTAVMTAYRGDNLHFTVTSFLVNAWQLLKAQDFIPEITERPLIPNYGCQMVLS